MTRHFLLRSVALILLALAAAAPSAFSQSLVTSSQALGMGGAAVAFPAPQSALYYNPAHLTHFEVTRAPITLLGLDASLTNNIGEQLDFYQNDLEPAIERGIDDLSDAEEATLYDGLFRVGRKTGEVSGTLMLPSFVMNRERYGVGGGFFARSFARNRVENAGAGVPGVDFSAFGDLTATAAASVNLSFIGLKSVSAGATARYTMRFLTLKTKPVDAFDENENVHALRGDALGVDLGLLYDAGRLVGPGRLLVGLAGYNVVSTDFDYVFQSYVTKNGERNDAEIADEITLANAHYQPDLFYRAGMAYVLPQTWRFVRETGIAVDYVSPPRHHEDRSLATRLRMGLQTSINDWLYLRAGLNQGYTTVGAGLHLAFVHIDYAYYGEERGRFAGQQPIWHHRVQVILGSF